VRFQNKIFSFTFRKHSSLLQRGNPDSQGLLTSVNVIWNFKNIFSEKIGVYDSKYCYVNNAHKVIVILHFKKIFLNDYNIDPRDPICIYVYRDLHSCLGDFLITLRYNFLQLLRDTCCTELWSSSLIQVEYYLYSLHIIPIILPEKMVRIVLKQLESL
jgi:hypothetical protein